MRDSDGIFDVFRAAGLEEPRLCAERPFSRCFLARHAEAAEGVYVKALRAGASAPREKFSREIEVLRAFSGCAGFPRLIAASSAPGLEFHACARIVAPDCAHFSSATTPPAFDDILRRAAGLARWIADFHARGYAHRDLSPDHVFALGDGQVAVIDFGYCKPLTGIAFENRGLCVGADLLGWGMIVWEMICGFPVFSYQRPELRMELRAQRALIAEIGLPAPLSRALIGALSAASPFNAGMQLQGGFASAGELLEAVADFPA